MEEKNEQVITSDTLTEQVKTESKGESKNETSFGKFKDLNSLLSAYNSLEAEFTKRSQKLKELEGNQDKNIIVAKEDAQSKEKSEKEIIEKYIKELITSKPQAVIINGGNSGITPEKKPKTIAEAGRLAQGIFVK